MMAISGRGPFTVEVYDSGGTWMTVEGDDLDRWEVSDIGVLRIYIVESAGTSVTDYPQHAWFGLQRMIDTQPPPPDVEVPILVEEIVEEPVPVETVVEEAP